MGIPFGLPPMVKAGLTSGSIMAAGDLLCQHLQMRQARDAAPNQPSNKSGASQEKRITLGAGAGAPAATWGAAAVRGRLASLFEGYDLAGNDTPYTLSPAVGVTAVAVAGTRDRRRCLCGVKLPGGPLSFGRFEGGTRRLRLPWPSRTIPM